MISISDILKVLDQWPKWKRITQLPDRLDEIEKRLADLESRLETGADNVCPSCGGGPYKLTGSRPHPMFGEVGVKERTYTCEACGFTENETVE